uniref:Uncharacterized protein n=1 Tax=uncultured marine group II/III euryarchaeote KM3_185_F09 TaxID=1457950 RepID=A0A075GRG4_9EURY|nr:hypothetical protein [uncultured marine group II/III euryarchaeote KM3_185_F09]
MTLITVRPTNRRAVDKRVGVEDGHVYLTRVVGGEVDHRLDEDVHLVAARGREGVGLPARICVPDGRARANPGSRGDLPVRALRQVLHVRLDSSPSSPGAAVHGYGNDCSSNAGVVRRVDARRIL